MRTGHMQQETGKGILSVVKGNDKTGKSTERTNPLFENAHKEAGANPPKAQSKPTTDAKTAATGSR